MADLVQLAKDIVKNNIYITLATCDSGAPWAAPVYYCVDEDYNFLFVSQLSSLHSRHVLKNPKVAFAIFDSHSEEGKGKGIQGEGKVKMLEGEDLSKEISKYHTTFIEIKEEFLKGDAAYRLFKLAPEHIFVTDPDAKVDKRTEVRLP